MNLTHPATLQSADRRGYPSDSQQTIEALATTQVPPGGLERAFHRKKKNLPVSWPSLLLPPAEDRRVQSPDPMATSCRFSFGAFSLLFFSERNEETWSTLSETRVRQPRRKTAQPDAAITHQSLPVLSASSKKYNTRTFRPFPVPKPQRALQTQTAGLRIFTFSTRCPDVASAIFWVNYPHSSLPSAAEGKSRPDWSKSQLRLVLGTSSFKSMQLLKRSGP